MSINNLSLNYHLETMPSPPQIPESPPSRVDVDDQPKIENLQQHLCKTIEKIKDQSLNPPNPRKRDHSHINSDNNGKEESNNYQPKKSDVIITQSNKRPRPTIQINNDFSEMKDNLWLCQDSYKKKVAGCVPTKCFLNTLTKAGTADIKIGSFSAAQRYKDIMSSRCIVPQDIYAKETLWGILGGRIDSKAADISTHLHSIFKTALSQNNNSFPAAFKEIYKDLPADTVMAYIKAPFVYIAANGKSTARIIRDQAVIALSPTTAQRSAKARKNITTPEVVVTSPDGKTTTDLNASSSMIDDREKDSCTVVMCNLQEKDILALWDQNAKNYIYDVSLIRHTLLHHLPETEASIDEDLTEEELSEEEPFKATRIDITEPSAAQDIIDYAAKKARKGKNKKNMTAITLSIVADNA